MLAAIDRKVAGEEVVSAPKEAAREQIIDLMAALKKSLEERKAGAAAQPAGPAKVKGKAEHERDEASG